METLAKAEMEKGKRGEEEEEREEEEEEVKYEAK